jgi:hypothetical protein
MRLPDIAAPPAMTRSGPQLRRMVKHSAIARLNVYHIEKYRHFIARPASLLIDPPEIQASWLSAALPPQKAEP